MEKLNLNRFLQDPEDHLGQYTLHAVLVHSGESTGHFIRAFHYNLKVPFQHSNSGKHTLAYRYCY